MASFVTIVFPVAARTSVHFALAARILLGLHQLTASTHLNHPMVLIICRGFPRLSFPCNDRGLGSMGSSPGEDKVEWIGRSRFFDKIRFQLELELAVNGACLGTLVIFSLSGYIAEHLGWAAVFYVTGYNFPQLPSQCNLNLNQRQGEQPGLGCLVVLSCGRHTVKGSSKTFKIDPQFSAPLHI